MTHAHCKCVRCLWLAVKPLRFDIRAASVGCPSLAALNMCTLFIRVAVSPLLFDIRVAVLAVDLSITASRLQLVYSWCLSSRYCIGSFDDSLLRALMYSWCPL